MKRYRDKPYSYFSIYAAKTTGLEVKCPYCNKLGIVKMDDVNHYFQCTVCGKRHQKGRVKYRYQVSEMCAKCDRHFNVTIDESQKHFNVLNVKCPYCQNMQKGTIQKINSGNLFYCNDEIRKGKEPFFGYPLFYQITFNEKIIWAINREHLVYLIDYIDADIRESREVSYQDYCGTKTQSDHLPKFVKLAKNRELIVKLLKRLLIST